MVDYSATDIHGWEMPSVISYGAFKLLTGSEGKLAHFAEYALNGSGQVQKDSDDRNKVWVKPYADTNSERSALGMFFRNKPTFAEDEDETPQIGMGSRRRDVSILHEGAHDIFYASGAESRYGMRLAPHVSGCREQGVGMSFAGYCLTPGIAAGSGFVKVRIFSYEEVAITDAIDDYVDEAFISGVMGW